MSSSITSHYDSRNPTEEEVEKYVRAAGNEKTKATRPSKHTRTNAYMNSETLAVSTEPAQV